MNARLGLLGGTFDPPHVGHLLLAETAREQLALDKVLFLPAGQPPHKGQVTAARHRLAMTRLAIAGDPHLAVDTTDIDRPPPHYTATLLPLLRQVYPQAAFWLLLGSDSLQELPAWYQPGAIIEQCRLAVLPRPGHIVDWVTLTWAVPGVDAVVDVLDGPLVNLSATDMRLWATAGRSLRYLTPAAVLDYIVREKLYDSADSAASAEAADAAAASAAAANSSAGT